MKLDQRLNRMILASEDNNACMQADLAERKNAIHRIGSSLFDAYDDADFTWAESYMVLEAESSLYKVQAPAIALFQAFLELPLILSIFAEENLHSRNSFVSADGGLYVYNPKGSVELTERVKRDPEATRALQNLVSAAKFTGGELYCAQYASIPQWLRFHGLDVPADAEGARNLLKYLEADLPAVDYLGNYWDQITGLDSTSIVLTSDEMKKIRRLTRQFVPAKKSLLDTLYEAARDNLPDNPSHHNADVLIADLVLESSSQAFAKKYIEPLQWYGVKEHEEVSKEELGQLLVTAILLDLTPWQDAGRHRVGTYDIYGTHLVDAHPFSSRLELEGYLVQNERVSRDLVPLASHLLLARVAPELIVKSIPAELTVGSVRWVLFSQAVSYIELTLKGAARYMSYSEIMDFADVKPVNEAMKSVRAIAAIESIVDWAVINEVITAEAALSTRQQAQQKAVAAYQAFASELVQTGQALLAPLPNRRKIALRTLKGALPGCNVLEEKLLSHNTHRLSRPFKMSMLDLHIEGDMEDWDRWETPVFRDLYPALYHLPSNQVAFEAAVSEHHSNLKAALATTMKLALSGLPMPDREILKSSKITFFTVRPAGGELVGTPTGQAGYSGTNLKTPQLKESQLSRDQATGRYGVIMCASDNNGRVTCYEMFTLRGECRKNIKLGQLINGSGKMHSASRVDFHGDLNELQPAATPYHLPLDINAYTKGAKSRNGTLSTVVIEKLGCVEAPSTSFSHERSLYTNFVNPQFGLIAKFIADNKFFASIEELKYAATVPTDRERASNTFDEWVTFIVDLIVPFKKCSEDLMSGERNKIVDGIYGCIMDTIGLVFTALGAVSMTLTTLAKVGSAASKATTLALYAVETAISVFNPLDGVPTLVYKKIKSLYQTGLRLSTHSLHLIEKASFHMRSLTGGAKSVDLLQAANTRRLSQGKWRPHGSDAVAFDVHVILKNDQWYAINRHNRPWGKPLTNFIPTQEASLSRVRRSLPNDVSKHLIEQSLPIARHKIDNALSVLTTPAFTFETDLAIGLFLGSSSNARDQLLNSLRIIRADVQGVSVSNVFLDGFKDHAGTISIQADKYQEWKNATDSAKKDHQYLTINPYGLTDRFAQSGYNYGQVADDLIQSLLRGGPGALDLVSAEDTQGQGATDQALNVAALLNLAAGNHPVPGGETTAGHYDHSQALVNADSYALLVALLSQRITNEQAFNANMDVIKSAIGANASEAVAGAVVVDLNAR
ncbi:hypothetical protein [Pseudomonas sp. TMB3-21]